MRAWRKRLVELALEVVEGVCSTCDSECKRRFRARTRNLIADLYTSGASYVVSVAAARSSAAAVEIGLTASSVSDMLRMCSDSGYARRLNLEGPEDLSYALYGASLLYALRAAGAVSASNLGDAIRGLLGNVVADRVALHAATWLKRFTEAYIHE